MYIPFPQFHFPRYVAPHTFNIPKKDFLYSNQPLNANKNVIDYEQKENTSINKTRDSNIKNEPLLEIAGLKLFDDDLLILLLIFFLYTQKINDILLFIALFALLFEI